MELYQDELTSPVGGVFVISDGTHLRAVDFEGYEARLHRLLKRQYGQYTLHAKRDPGGAVTRLTAYFSGDWQAVDELAVATNGTLFQRKVWAELRTIPAGTTLTYAAIAERIGSPKACRAVGLANGSNPIGIVVPCHRVIGSNQALVGYGGGLERKEWLLRHEGVQMTRRMIKMPDSIPR